VYFTALPMRLRSKEIVRKVWGPEYVDEVGYVRRYIWHLRKKIEPDPERPRYIHNQRGFGYYFQVSDAPDEASVTSPPPP